MKIRFFTIILLVLAAIPVYAGSISCTAATPLVPDGRLLDFDSVQANTANWYQFTATAGRSYSIEVRDDLDPNSTDFTITYYGPNGSCPSPPAITSAAATVTDTHGYEPVLPALTSPSTARASIVTTASGGGMYWIKVQNTNTTTSHYVSVSVTETTLYSPAWNTCGGLITQWILSNTTSQPVNFTITLTATSVSPPVTYTTGLLTLGAPSSSTSGQTLSTAAGFTPSVPTGSSCQTGYVVLTHSGPPGAISVYADENNWPTGVYVVPMGPMRGK
ncbi:MAG TPA: hypothetical protein VK738_20295 [Terriglobales bacterium]|nr:hypothetical protein [Terriglobales bacterium]